MAPTRISYEKQQEENKTKKMNEGVPFFVFLMAMTTHKMGGKNLESVGNFEAFESFKRKKQKTKWGEEVGRLWLIQKEMGH